MQFNSMSSGTDGRSFQQKSQNEYLNMPINQVPIKSNNTYGQNYETGSNNFSGGNRNYSLGPGIYSNQSQVIPGVNQQSKNYSDGNASVIYNPARNNWECAVCHKSFRERKDLDQHLNSRAHEPIQYACNQCGKGFASIGALTLHAEQAGHVHAFSGQSPTSGVGDLSKEMKPLMSINKSNSYGNMMGTGLSGAPTGSSTGFKQQQVGMMTTSVGPGPLGGGRMMNHAAAPIYGNGGGSMLNNNNNNKMRFHDGVQNSYAQQNYTNPDTWVGGTGTVSPNNGQYGNKTNDCEFCLDKFMSRNDLKVHMMRDHNMTLPDDRNFARAVPAAMIGGPAAASAAAYPGGVSMPIPMTATSTGRYGANSFSSVQNGNQYPLPLQLPLPPRPILRNYPETSAFGGSITSIGSTSTGVTDDSAATTANGSHTPVGAAGGTGESNWSPGSTPITSTMTAVPNIQLGILYFGGLCKTDPAVGTMIGGCAWWISNQVDVLIIQGSLPVKLSNISLMRVEYEGLLNGLKMALLRGFRSLVVRGSSEAILNHLFEENNNNNQGSVHSHSQQFSQGFRSAYTNMTELKESTLSFFPQFERLEFELVSADQNQYVHQMADTIITSCLKRQSSAVTTAGGGAINLYSNVSFNASGTGTTQRTPIISHSASLDSSIHSNFASRDDKIIINGVVGNNNTNGNANGVTTTATAAAGMANRGNNSLNGNDELNDAFGAFTLQGSAQSFFPSDSCFSNTGSGSGLSAGTAVPGGNSGNSMSSDLDDYSHQLHMNNNSVNSMDHRHHYQQQQLQQQHTSNYSLTDPAYAPFGQSSAAVSMFGGNTAKHSPIDDALMRGGGRVEGMMATNSLFVGGGGGCNDSEYGQLSLSTPREDSGREHSNQYGEYSSNVNALDSNDPVFDSNSPLSSSFGRSSVYSTAIGVGRTASTDLATTNSTCMNGVAAATNSSQVQAAIQALTQAETPGHGGSPSFMSATTPNDSAVAVADEL